MASVGKYYYLRDQPGRSFNMSTAGETSTTITEPEMSSAAPVISTVPSAEINNEAELDAALAAEQQRLDRLAQQQRVLSKQQNL